MTALPDPGAPSGYFAALERHRPTMDLTAAAARRDRDHLAHRTDILDKAGVLATLPGNLLASTAMVAKFYEVDYATLLKLIQRNRDELDSDGFRLVGRAEVVDILSSTPDELGMPRTAPSIGVFHRRAVLRVGMLLRDSYVARRVRDYLLDAETATRAPEPLSGTELMAAALVEAHRILADRDRRIVELSASAEAWDALVEHNDSYRSDDAAKILSRDPAIGPLGQRRLLQFLAGEREVNDRKLPRPWIYRGRGMRWRAYQDQIDLGRLEMKPGGRYAAKGDKTHLNQGEPVVLITAKGLSDLRRFLTTSGQLALV